MSIKISTVSKDKEIAYREIRRLRKLINKHNYLYYIKNKPIISDKEYDSIVLRLVNYEKRYPDFKNKSPIKIIEPIDINDHSVKIQHASLMLSLKSTLDESEVQSFFKTAQTYFKNDSKKSANFENLFVLEPKFDGVSVEIVYKIGVFQYGAIRGDGEKGENISDVITKISSILLKLNGEKSILPSFLSLRGEVVLRREYFQSINKFRIEHSLEPFSNLRNATAGIIRRININVLYSNALDIYFYDFLGLEGVNFKYHTNFLNQLKEWGLKVNIYNTPCNSIDDVKIYYDKISEIREKLDYDIDGIVIKINDYSLRNIMGFREKNPRWAIAWKFKPKENITRIDDIIVQVGRTGVLTPVALLQPVDVNGVTISRATLHNENEIHKKKLNKGVLVKVIRSGDVIPEIIESIQENQENNDLIFKMPRHCPSCQSTIIKKGVLYYCPAGLSCIGQLIHTVVHFTSRKAMNIDGLGKNTIEQLIENNLIKNISDLYDLSIEKLKKLNGFTEKKPIHIFNSIQKSKIIPFHRFIYALSIPKVGEHVAHILAHNFANIHKLQNTNLQELSKIFGLGPAVISSILIFFKDKQNRNILKRLLNHGIKFKSTLQKKYKNFYNKNFVITGTLKKYLRSNLSEIIRYNGGKIMNNVGKNIDYIIVGNSPGSKLQKALDLGIKILTEKDLESFLKM